MNLTTLTRLYFSLPSISIPKPFSLTQQLFQTPKPKYAFTLLLSSPKSTLSDSVTSTPPEPSAYTRFESQSLDHDSIIFPDSHFEFSPERLFVPPDTDISSLRVPLSSRILKGSNIVRSKYATDDQVIKAEFVKSSPRTEDCPSDGLPEFALVGRSNVGKSSLLNSLVRRKSLALISKKPGKTRLINHFRINDSWYLVDLPGYGYAVASRDLRTDWNKFTKDYFLNRSSLVSVFLLVDASIPPRKSDLEYASWLGQNQIPMTLIFTKCDKRKKERKGGRRPAENVREFEELICKFFKSMPPWIMTSSVTKQGRNEILVHMSQLRNFWLKH